MIKTGQFRSGELHRVQKRGYQATSAKTVPVNENHSDRECCFISVVSYLAEVVTLGEFALHHGTHVFPCWNDEVGMPDEDFHKSGAVIKTRV